MIATGLIILSLMTMEPIMRAEKIETIKRPISLKRNDILGFQTKDSVFAQKSLTLGSIVLNSKKTQSLLPASDWNYDLLSIADNVIPLVIADSAQTTKIEIQPKISEIKPNEVVQFQLIATNADSNKVVNSNIRWSVSEGYITEDGRFYSTGNTNAEPIRIQAVISTSTETKIFERVLIQKNRTFKDSILKSEILPIETTETFLNTDITALTCTSYKNICLIEKQFYPNAGLQALIGRYSNGQIMQIVSFDYKGNIMSHLYCDFDGVLISRSGNLAADCSISRPKTNTNQGENP